MKTRQPHTQAEQTHSAAPSTSQPRQAQRESPDADAIAHSPRMTAQRQAIRAAFGTHAASAQLQVDADQQLLDDMPAPAEATHRAEAGEDAPNLTSMPNQLKSGIETLSGMDMSEVRVHRHSDKPAQLSALAYAQGNDIHLGSGQEKHLGHEAWHVVQQRQERVKVTMQMAGMGVNDEVGSKSEADLMGCRPASRAAEIGMAIQSKGMPRNLRTLSEPIPRATMQAYAMAAQTAPIPQLQSRRGLNHIRPLSNSSQPVTPGLGLSSEPIQAVLVPIVDNGDITTAIERIGAELDRQEKIATPGSIVISRVTSSREKLSKAKAEFKPLAPAQTVTRLNAIIGILNKNISENHVPDVSDLDSKKPAPEDKQGVSFASSSSVLTLSDAMRDPIWQRAKDLGVLDHEQIHFWLSPEYLKTRGREGIPQTNLMGIIVELQAKDALEAKHEEAFVEGKVEVFSSVKIVDLKAETTVREIDLLACEVDAKDNLIPLELVEAKKSKSKPKGLATDVTAKIKALSEVAPNGHRVFAGKEDLTDRLKLDQKAIGTTAGPSSEYGLNLGDPALPQSIYDFVNKYRYALSQLWHV